MPTIVTETAKTTVMVNDGGTIVIGGLYKITEDHSNDGVPHPEQASPSRVAVPQFAEIRQDAES